MSQQYTVTQFVKAFEKAYQTIDIRAAIIEHEGQWQSVCAVLRIHMAPMDIIKREYKELINRYGFVDSSKIRIIKHCFPFKDYNQLADEFSKGQILLENMTISLDSRDSIMNSKGYINWSLETANRDSITNWPVLKTSVNLPTKDNIHGLLQSDPEIQRQVAVSGYSDPYSPIRYLLQVEFTSATTPHLVIESEVPARIDQVEAKKTKANDIKLKMHLMAHQNLANPFCTVRVKNPYLKNPLLQQNMIPMKPGIKRNFLQKWIGEIKLTPKANDRIEIEFGSENIGSLYSREFRPYELLPIVERNPLFVALTRFCSEEEFKNLLEAPHFIKTPQKVSLKYTGTLFEVSIQWLLSNLGFSAIWLHGYEKMKDGSHDYGSVDCIAYHKLRNVLLLVHCTLAPPNPNEINRHMELSHHLSEQVFHNTSIMVYSVLFTASHKIGEKESNIDDYDNVRVFYKEDIPKLIELVKKGEESKFIDAIVNPLFSPFHS